jgi:hypothetical protein
LKPEIKFTHGHLPDGTQAPENSDKDRLDYMARNPGVVLNLKSGVRAKNVPGYWQPSLRAAIDAAMETDRRLMRTRRGLEPEW